MSERGLVLFVCLHGSAKSLIAAEFFNRLAVASGLALRAASAGTEPDDSVPAHVVAAMRSDGCDVSRYRPQRLNREIATFAFAAITFEPDLSPYLPEGCPVERWTVPAVSDGYAAARDAIRERVERLITRLAAELRITGTQY